MAEVKRNKRSRNRISPVFNECCTLLHKCHQRTNFVSSSNKCGLGDILKNSLSGTVFVDQLAVIAMLGPLTIVFFGLFRCNVHYILQERKNHLSPGDYRTAVFFANEIARKTNAFAE